jgi:steroid delta-isomerase-like uncharacterized protein
MKTDVLRIIREFALSLSSHNVEQMASLLTQDCLYEDVALGIILRGRSAFKNYSRQISEAIPDLEVRVTSCIISADGCGWEWHMSGTPVYDLLKIPATGNSFSIRGASITELGNGKILRNIIYYDLCGLLRQLQEKGNA